MFMLPYLLPFLISLFSSLAFTFLIKNIAKKYQILDRPGARKIHKREIPLLGGVAIFLSFFLVLFIFSGKFLAGDLSLSHLLGFFIGALLIIIGGVLDDKYDLSPKLQIIFPILAVVALIIGGVQIEKITNPFGGLVFLNAYLYIQIILLSIWMLGMMYTTKLLDGIDGLVSGIGAVGSIVIFLFTLTTRYHQPDIALAGIILAGACLGFLVFNFHPAKIFLGEGGSLFIGYSLGVLSIISGSKIAVALLIMGIPILDVLWTIIRRLIKGKNPFKFADKKHLHHRFLSLGLSQGQTACVFYFLSGAFGVSGLFLQSRGKFFALLGLLVLMALIVIIFYLLDYLKQSKKRKLLLHICCAPCATYNTLNKLMPQYRVTWFFYNPNLVSQEEYDKRLLWVKKMAKNFSIPLIVIPYNNEAWQKKIKGRETDPERGGRCLICYLDRLREVVVLAKKKGFQYFSTSLLYSPYKDTKAIKKQGRDLAESFQINFLELDFLSENGYHDSQKLAKDLGMYRQKFCGCLYSIRQKYVDKNGENKKVKKNKDV